MASTGPQSEDCGEWLVVEFDSGSLDASTGPQSEDCGEEYQCKCHGCANGFASTGPQSEDCGERAQSRSRSNRRSASTGPQSEDCGEGLSCRGARADVCGFNGAAVRRLRRGGQLPRICADPAGFNGAAVRRLRRARTLSHGEGTLAASTGPQSEDCGERAACGWAFRPSNCFNGAAVRRLRRGAQT